MDSNRNKISLTTAILMSMNIMIGAGIIAAPSLIAASSGSFSFLAWGFTALLFLPIVIGTSMVAQLVDNEGGIYSYATVAFGRLAGFLTGAVYYIGYTFSVATVLLVLKTVLMIKFSGVALIANPYTFYAIALAVIAALNLSSIAIMNMIQTPAILMKFTPLIVVVAALPFVLGNPMEFDWSQLSALPSTLSMSIFSYFGFEYACNIGRYMENREVNGPRAMIIGFLATVGLYTLFHIGVMYMMGLDNLTSLTASSFPAFLPISSAYIKGLIATATGIAILVSYASTSNGITFGNITLLYGLAKDNFLKGSSILSQTNKNDRPWVATLVQLSMVYLLSVSNLGLGVLNNTSNLGLLLAFVITMAALVYLLLKRNSSAFKLCIGFIALASTLGLVIYSFMKLGSTTQERLVSTIPFLICVAISLLLYKNDDSCCAPAQK